MIITIFVNDFLLNKILRANKRKDTVQKKEIDFMVHSEILQQEILKEVGMGKGV